ncbi:uncharacterized protein LOC115453553 isoform X2 [Manduca sexta]|nr:uncharacterized protein LOC115453553 isoform X2 [Manduca sexta]XP_037300542.1 uncharacterized protein LOC115453553 isoform X2 [Manduca sexta]KAG6465074.1 hypothetical protein O3G_MSEX014921 [Manduca sexta]KAG6465075.1 hypothetical protein O3G_MSEX014921 [Manduca sexta]KAG6465076.1 hypothetical protein O3G_MSEX014921 [Manduca sexta]
MCVNKDQVYLYEAIPLMLYIHKPTSIKLIGNKFECYRHDNNEEKILFVESSIHEHYLYALIPNFNSIINYKYTCYFLLNIINNRIGPQYKHDGPTGIKIDCEFRLAIIYWESLKVEINGNVMDNEPVFSSKEVNAIVTYKFVLDELVNIKCKKPNHQNGTIRFVYNVDSYYASVASTEDVDFQVVLKAHHHGTHIDCIFQENTTKTLLRVYMLLDKKNVEDIIRVNGLAIRQSGNIVRYYYTGSVPTVFCPGPVDVEWCFKSHDDHNAEANCTIGGRITKVQMYEDFPRNGIYIKGLTDNKIIFQTYEEANSIRKILYTYSDDDIIQLSAWYEEQYVYCSINGLSSVAEKRKPITLRMRKEYNLTNVVCKINIFKTDILFRYVKSNSTNNPPPAVSGPVDATQYDWCKMVILLVILILIILVAVVAVAIRNKRNSTSKLEQAEDIANTENNKYNAQLPKRLHKEILIEFQKKTVGSAARVPTGDDIRSHSTTSHQNIEDLYTIPIPKNQRVKNKEEINYAELQFKDNNIYSQINPTQPQCIYSEVNHAQPNTLYAEVIHEDHHNLELGHCYANVRRDYVTPNSDVAFKRNNPSNDN